MLPRRNFGRRCPVPVWPALPDGGELLTSLGLAHDGQDPPGRTPDPGGPGRWAGDRGEEREPRCTRHPYDNDERRG
jgi:hypothetical protein